MGFNIEIQTYQYLNDEAARFIAPLNFSYGRGGN